MESPAAFFWIFLLLGCLRIPFMLYRRQQIRNNPARQAAGAEDITFRTTILLRFKNPGRLLLSQHWYYGKASPIELIVRSSTFQVTRWGLGRRSRHYGGWFLPSSGSTMWVARMRFFPLGQQECIVVAGTYPWRGGQRQVELAMGTQGRSAEIWAALAASGVRPLSGPGAPVVPPAQREMHGISYGIPRPEHGAPPPGLPYAAGPPVVVGGPGVPALSAPLAPSAPAPYVPSFESPAVAAVTRGRIARRTVLTIGLVLCFPFLAAFIFAHAADLGHRSSALSVALSGSPAVATVSGASCTRDGDDVDVAGTISATAAAPLGMTLSASIEPEPGEASSGLFGLTARVPITVMAVGQSQPFHGVVTGATAVSDSDQCVISWVANSASTATTP
jgi:hypothetical protein